MQPTDDVKAVRWFRASDGVSPVPSSRRRRGRSARAGRKGRGRWFRLHMAVVVRRDRRPTFLPNGGFVLESAAAVVPDIPEDHLDHAGGGDREQRTEHAEEFDPEEDCDDDGNSSTTS